jgi:hypothetical protein
MKRSWLFALLCACASEDVGVSTQAIFDNDSAAADDNFAHPAVFPLVASPFGCTATLVARDTFLTAAHCVDDGATQYFVLLDINLPGATAAAASGATGGDTIAIDQNGDGADDRVWVLADPDVRIFPGYTSTPTRRAFDLALVRTSTTMPRAIVAPLAVDTTSPPQWIGQTVRMLGAGHTNAACTSGIGTDVRRLDAAISTVQLDAGMLAYVLPGLGGGTGSHICDGDSGGPMLANERVVSVLSGASTDAVGPAVGLAYDWLMANGLDVDGDGIQAALDNCEDVANPDQADADDNGIGDACQDTDTDGVLDIVDPCPHEGTSANSGDLDGDGVCDSHDNCLHTPNPNQRNCNEVSEEEYGLAAYGDACDPSPCADMHVTTTVSGASTNKYLCTDVPSDVCPLEPGQTAWMTCKTVEAAQVKIRPLKPGCPGGPGTCTPIGANALATSVRFCQDPNSASCASTEFAHREPNLDSAFPEPLGTSFLRMSLGGFGPNTVTLINYTAAFDDWTTVVTLPWDFQADFTRWTTQGYFSVASPLGLEGAMWSHVDAALPTEQPRRNAFDLDTQPIAAAGCNACFFLDIPTPVGGSTGGDASHPRFVWRPRSRVSFARLGAALGEASLVAFDRGLVGAVTNEPTCGGEIANGRVSANALSAMTKGLTWVGHAEAYDAIGDDPEVAIAIDASGNVLDAARWKDDRFIVDRDRDVVRSARRGLAATAGWFPVYSITEGRLYAIGGVDAAKQPTRAIYTTRISDAQWTRLATSYQPTSVLAATYARGRLWVLDGTSTTARLASIDVRTGAFTIHGDWARDPATWDHHWLVATTDGSLLFASSSTSRGKHVISRIAASTNAVAIGSALAGVLVNEPIVDEAGISRILRADTRRRTARVERAAIVTTPATMRNLGAQL